MNSITEGLINENIEVKVVAIETMKHPVLHKKISSDYINKVKFESEFIDTSIKVVDAFSNLFSSKSYNIERFYSDNFSEKLISILEKDTFDIIHLEGLFVTPYLDLLKKYSKAKIVLRAHNVEHVIWERKAKEATNPIKKIYLNHLAKKLKNYENKVLNKFDGIVSISSKDTLFFNKEASNTPTTTISVGIDTNNSEVIIKNLNSIFHIGAMDWTPNVDALNWFLKNVWTKINKKYPELKFVIAGRKSKEAFQDLNYNNVEVIGEVEDAKKFISEQGLMVVPLFSGSGIRVKIIEGLSLGKTIITSKIGAEGIDYKNFENLIVVDTPEEYVSAISKCIEDKILYNQIGVNARILAQNNFDRTVLTNKLINFYKSL